MTSMYTDGDVKWVSRMPFIDVVIKKLICRLWGDLFDGVVFGRTMEVFAIILGIECLTLCLMLNFWAWGYVMLELMQ